MVCCGRIELRDLRHLLAHRGARCVGVRDGVEGGEYWREGSDTKAKS